MSLAKRLRIEQRRGRILDMAKFSLSYARSDDLCVCRIACPSVRLAARHSLSLDTPLRCTPYKVVEETLPALVALQYKVPRSRLV